MSDHRLKQGSGDRLWQRIHASAVRGRLAKADAGQCQSMVTDSANHVLCLPEFVAQDAASSVQRMQPRQPNDVLRIRSRKRLDWLSIPRDELERRAEWPKLALLNEGQMGEAKKAAQQALDKGVAKPAEAKKIISLSK